MWSSEYKRPCLVWYSDIYLPCLIFWYLPTHIFNLLYQAWYQSIENVKIYEKHETYKCFIVITIVLKSMEKKSGYNITASELYCSNSLIIRPWFFNIYYCILNLFVFLFFCIFGDNIIGFDQTAAFANVFVYIFVFVFWNEFPNVFVLYDLTRISKCICNSLTCNCIFIYILIFHCICNDISKCICIVHCISKCTCIVWSDPGINLETKRIGNWPNSLNSLTGGRPWFTSGVCTITYNVMQPYTM